MDFSAIVAKLKQYPIPVISIAVSIIFGAILFLRSSQLPEIVEKEKQLSEKVDAFGKNEARGANLDEHLNSIKELAGQIDKRLMVHEQKAINYQFFFQLEERSGVRVTALNQAPKVPYPTKVPPGRPVLTVYNPVQYSVTIEGTFKEVLDFIYQLQYGKYFARIERFSCSQASRTAPGNVSLSMNVELLGTL